jgi:hypothetical protein
VRTSHRHQEWLRFLQMIDRATPAGFDIHVIADNYGTHKHARATKGGGCGDTRASTCTSPGIE